MSRWCEFSQTSFLPSTSPKMDPGGRWTWFPMCKLKISSSISWPKRRFWDSGAGWCWWCWMGFNGGSFHNRIPGVFVLAVVHWYTRLCLQRDLLHCYTFIHFLRIADICRYCSTNCPLLMIESLGHKCWSRAQIGYNRSGFFFLLIFSSRCEWNERKKSKTGANAHKKIHKGTKTKSATQFITRECIFEQPLWYLLQETWGNKGRGRYLGQKSSKR